MEAVVFSDVLVGVERPQQVECGPRAPHHRDRHRAVERDHWIRRDAFESLVEGEDLWPIGVLCTSRFSVDCGDRQGGGEKPSCTASSHTSNLPYRRTSTPRACGASWRSRSSASSGLVALREGSVGDGREPVSQSHRSGVRRVGEHDRAAEELPG